MISQTKQLAILPNYVKTRMENTVRGLKPQYFPGTCHYAVANKVKERQEPSDIIWLYGNSSTDVMHSVLTDKRKNVLIDTWKNNKSNLIFSADKGYSDKDTGSTFEGLEYITSFSAADLL